MQLVLVQLADAALDVESAAAGDLNDGLALGSGFVLRQNGDHLAVKVGVDIAVAHFGLLDLVIRFGYLDLEAQLLDLLFLLGAHLRQLRGGIAAAGVRHIRVGGIGAVRVVRYDGMVGNHRSVKELEHEAAALPVDMQPLPSQPVAQGHIALGDLEDHVVIAHGNRRLFIGVFRRRGAGIFAVLAPGIPAGRTFPGILRRIRSFRRLL